MAEIDRSAGTQNLLSRTYQDDELYHVLTEDAYKLICSLLYDMRYVGDIIDDDSISQNKTWSANKLNTLNTDNIKASEIEVHQLSEINNWLDIKEADLVAAKAIIDDSSISVNKTWSANKVMRTIATYVPEDAFGEDADTVTQFVLKLNDAVGDLNELSTDNKASLVDAIVELVTKLGNPADLQTVAKDNIVDSINDLNKRLVPVGSVLPFGGDENAVPEGYLLCDGTEYKVKDYQELFDVIGYTYSTSNDLEKFKVPDLKGRVPVGLLETNDNFMMMGQTGGSETVELTEENLPEHDHTYETLLMNTKSSSVGSVIPMLSIDSIKNSQDFRKIRLYNDSNSYVTREIGYDKFEREKVKTSNVVDAIPHNNLQPYVVLNYIIKY